MQKLLQRLSSGYTLLAVALALGVLTAVLTLSVLAGSDDAVEAPQPVPIDPLAALEAAGDPLVVARDLIPAGTALTTPMVEVIEVRKGTSPEGSFEALEDVVGRVVRTPMVRREAVLASKLVSTDAGSLEGLAFSVPRGKRAISVGFSEVLGAGGLVVPGDRVDILISTNIAVMFGPGEVPPPDDDPDHPIVFTLMQDVLVLAIGRTFTRPLESGGDPTTLRLSDPQVPGAGTITVAVTPDQAQTLFFAAERGKLGFALRSYGDGSLEQMTPEYKLTPVVTGAGAG